MELITIRESKPVLSAGIASQIAEFERQVKEITEQEKTLKEAILAEMEAKGLSKVETDELVITYIAPTDRERFDSKAFRADHSDLYDNYVVMSPVKAQIRIKVR